MLLGRVLRLVEGVAALGGGCVVGVVRAGVRVVLFILAVIVGGLVRSSRGGGRVFVKRRGDVVDGLGGARGDGGRGKALSWGCGVVVIGHLSDELFLEMDEKENADGGRKRGGERGERGEREKEWREGDIEEFVKEEKKALALCGKQAQINIYLRWATGH